MPIKDLFNKNKKEKVLSNTSIEELGKEIESYKVRQYQGWHQTIPSLA